MINKDETLNSCIATAAPNEVERGTIIDRRRALAMVGAAGSMAVLGCSSDGTPAATAAGGAAGSGGTGGSSAGGSTGTGGTSGASGSTGDAASSSCHEIPDETPGPYPDTKGMISNSSYFRSDIREDRTGTLLTLVLTIVDAGNVCAPISGANVEIWHCDKDGIYSEYASNTNAGSTTTTYLRGVQTTDTSGQVTFTTIYPGWYSPRATHVHIQVFNGTTLKKTTQIGFPDASNQTVYAQTSLYTKGQNSVTNDNDQVFGNATGNGTDGGGHTYQIADLTGDTTSGYAASIAVAMTGYG